MSNLEYIIQARKLLNEDYKTKYINEYNSWLANHQNSWQQPHTVVPYPPFVVSAAIAPFKASAAATAPTEQAVVDKALELYNQFNPKPVAEPAPVAKPIVEQAIVEQPVAETIIETIIEPVAEELVVEPIVEQTLIELAVEKPVAHTDTIYKIFQESVAEVPIAMPTIEPMQPTIEQALNVVPQPAEELARVKASGRILPSVLQRLQEIKDKWSTTEEKNV